MHRLGRKSSIESRDLIVKFTPKEVRDDFYLKRKKTAPSKHPEENGYINDHITEYRKGLFYTARRLYKAKLVCAAWTQQGNVVIRKTTDTSPVQVFSYSDLKEYSVTKAEENMEKTKELTKMSDSTTSV